MTDPVNNPSHYNQNGIEVIDVIETYAKHDFRLANVLKYVCRSGYKGHPLQDLQKAQWYLNRVVSEMEVVAALTDESWLGREEPVDDAENNAWLRGYNEGYEDGEADNRVPAKYNEPETGGYAVGYKCHEQEEEASDEPETGGYTEREVDVFFEGYECRKQEQAEEAIDAELEFHASLATRIAGDTESAAHTKGDYYGFDPLEIKGYCANCDCEISLGQPHLTTGDFEEGVIFCKLECMDYLRSWQRGLK